MYDEISQQLQLEYESCLISGPWKLIHTIGIQLLHQPYFFLSSFIIRMETVSKIKHTMAHSDSSDGRIWISG